MIALIALLCWDPVTLDCEGHPESAVVYMDEEARIDVVGSQLCIAGDDTSGECPVYLVEPFTVVELNDDPCVPEPWTPGVGEVLVIRTTAIDAAGNPDCGP